MFRITSVLVGPSWGSRHVLRAGLANYDRATRCFVRARSAEIVAARPVRIHWTVRWRGSRFVFPDAAKMDTSEARGFTQFPSGPRIACVRQVWAGA